MKYRSVWIAQTGVFLALLIAAQIVTRPLGNTFVTGSVTNLLLILTVMVCGLSSAIALSVISPFFATLIGIGPLWPFIPVIIAANLALVTLWRLIAFRHTNTNDAAGFARRNSNIEKLAAALVIAALVKFLVLYTGIVKLVVPHILMIEEPQASAVSAAFSWPQLITATVGGLLAILIFPVLSKALPRNKFLIL